MKWPGISVIIPTYNRAATVYATIVRLQTYLRYNGIITYLVGVDGDDDTPEMLDEWFGHMTNVVVMEGPRRTAVGNKCTGLGANLNMLLEAATDDLIIQLDDDHHLLKRLDLHPHVEHLIQCQAAGWIRLMRIGYHQYTATLLGHYWYVHWDSDGPYSLYIPSNRPHLKHRRFHDYFGPYPEGMRLGRTEEAFCQRCRNMAKQQWLVHPRELGIGERTDLTQVRGDLPPFVLVPLNSASETAWAHVGESWQDQGE